MGVTPKTELRRKLKSRRNDVQKAQNYRALIRAANANLITLIESFPEAHVIGGYMPIHSELDPLETMTHFFDQGAQIAVPVITGADQPLDWASWTPTSEMQEGPFKARIPKDLKRVVPEILIVPLLGFDLLGQRIGYGGGFYDRSLEELRQAQRITAIGFAFDAQETQAIPTERTDQALDFIVTPTKNTKF